MMPSPWLLLLTVVWLNQMLGSCEDLQEFAMEPYDQTAVIGSEVTLPCRVRNRKGVLQWTRDEFGLGTSRDLDGYDRYTMAGSDDENDFSLKISPVKLEDDALFQCQVSPGEHYLGIRSRNAKITILVPPEEPEIVEGGHMQTTAGKEVKLECISLYGKPAATIIWLDEDGNTLDSNYTVQDIPGDKRQHAKAILNLNPSRHFHNKTLACQAENSALRVPHYAYITLEVKYPPEVTLVARNTYIRETDTVEMDCGAEANPPAVSYRWYRNNHLLEGERGSLLALPGVVRSMNGVTISCEVTNQIGTTRATHKLDVQYAPYFVSFPKNIAAEMGSEVRLHCDIQGNPQPSIRWSREDRNEVIGVGEELKIRSLSSDETGTYRCRAKVAEFPELVADITVLMKAAPIVKSAHIQSGMNGDTVHVECVAVCVPTADAIVWSRFGKPLAIDNIHYTVVEEATADGVKNILIIHGSQDEDFGPYNCTVRNQYGVASAEIVLRKEKNLPLHIILFGVIGGVTLTVSVIIVAIMCQRRRHKGNTIENPSPVSKPLPSPITQGNLRDSLDSDVKVEIRTSSSLSNGHVQESEHWDPDDVTKCNLTPDHTKMAHPQVFPHINNGYMPSSYILDYKTAPLNSSRSSLYSNQSIKLPATLANRVPNGPTAYSAPLYGAFSAPTSLPNQFIVPVAPKPVVSGLGTHV